MSRPPVICLKKEEPRSRYVRREVLSVFETFMNFRDLLQVVSAFFVAVRSLVARSRSHPVAFQGVPDLVFLLNYRNLPKVIIDSRIPPRIC